MAAPHGSGGVSDNDAAGKEMRFFWRTDWRERIDWYRSHFTPMTTSIRGEATPAYSAHPFHPGVAERIHSVIPEARLIYLVRDPIDRIVAHYVQQRVDGDWRPFEERMRDCELPEHSIVCPSRYATQVERYLAHFPASQLLVVDQHDLKHDRRETLRRIFAFLGVEREFWSAGFAEEHNMRADKHALTPLGRRMLNGWIDPLGRRLAPRRWSAARPAVRRALSRRLDERPVVEDELRERLAVMLAPEVARLRELTGQRFASWSL